MTDREKEFVDKLLGAGLVRYSAAEPPAGFVQRLLAALRAAEREEPVDELLAGGLARFSAVEPRSGLEQRLLAGLKAQPRPSSWLSWRWAGALATAAAALVVVIFFLRQPQEPPLPPQTVATPPAPSASAEPGLQPTPYPNASRGREAAASPARLGAGPAPAVDRARLDSPRLETFPAPAPLSEQERLLLLFARQTPQEAALVAQARSRPTEALGIAPLPQIEELVKKPEENNN